MWPAIIALLIDRAAAGFPIISAWLNRKKPAVVALAAEVGPSDGPQPVGAAPQPVKDLVLAFLRRMQGRTSGGLAFTLGLLIQFAPLLEDSAWDAIQSLLDGQPVPPAPAAAFEADVRPAEAFADCCEQHLGG